MANIADFLASIGFTADEKSLNAALGKVKMFGLAVAGLAASGAAIVASAARKYEDLGKASKSLGVGVEELQAMQYAAEQSGSSADALTASLAGIKASRPWIKDTGAALEQVGRNMRGMSDRARLFYAQKMGIDPDLIPMLIKDTTALKGEFSTLYQQAGIDGAKAAEEAKAFGAEINKLQTISVLLKDSLGLSLMGPLRGQIEKLRRFVVENFDKIKLVMEGLIALSLRIVAAVGAFAARIIKGVSTVVDWFTKMDSGGKKVALTFGALLVAWRLLSKGFLATPLGALVLALGMVVGLVEDYLTYMEGGESYFDWGPWEDSIEGVRAVLSKIIDVVGSVISKNADLITAIGAGIGVFMGLQKVITLVKSAASVFKLLNMIILANPILALLTLALMAALLIIENWDDVKAFLVGVWDAIATAASDVADQIEKEWQGLKDWFAALWTDATSWLPDFGAWADASVDLIKRAFGVVFGWIGGKIDGLTNMLPDWIRGKIGLTSVAPDPERQDAPTSPAVNVLPGWIGGLLTATPPDLERRDALAPSPAAAAQLAPPAITRMDPSNEVTIEQKTEIKVMGAENPQATAEAVARAQGGVNGQMARNMRGALR